MLDRVRIVLVRPQGAANLGAVCRAMHNMGLTDLVLVSPEARRDDDWAVAFAARSRKLLESAREVASIAEALEGCVASFATSGKGGFYRRRAAVDVETAAREMLDRGAGGPVAVAFGPEDRGLLQEEILLFDRVVEIPANPEYPVLNLAAAVLIVCHELRREWMRRAGVVPSPPDDEAADDVRKRVLYEKLFAALDGIGFFSRDGNAGANPDHLKYVLRRVLGRVNLTVSETDVLIGMAQQIAYASRRELRD
jgi:tRNA/rRNA methyltransferase